MKALKILLPAIFFLAVQSFPALAVSIHKCEDSQGNITYEKHCPPGTSSVSEKQYKTKSGGGGGGNAASGPVTLYIVPDCDSCKQVEEFLAVRGIQVNQIDVNDDVELQNELREIAGDLRVPALVVNDEVVMGYDRSAMLDALSRAGYQVELETGGDAGN